MRVYGASPLYSYVELVFRSKRLFIVSIVLATAIVSTMAAMRGGQYNAMAMILLTGKADSAMGDNPDLGSVRYKLNLLNIYLKDPEFMKTAIRNAINEQKHLDSANNHVWETGQLVDYHFPTNMSELEFDNYCKEARQAINFAQGEGILELSCRWKNEQAADIINAFFWEFHDRVVAQESVNSTRSKTLLTQLLDDYKKREKGIEKTIIDYQRGHVDQPPVDVGTSSSSYVQMQRGLEEMRLSIKMAQEQRDEYAQQLRTIPEKIKVSQVEGNSDETPAVKSAQGKVNDTQSAVDSLKLKYQESHPKVREALAALAQAETELANAKKQSKLTPNIQSTTTAVNPEYMRTVGIIKQADAQLKGLLASYDLKQKQAAQEKHVALAAPGRNYEYKWLTDEYGIVGQIRSNLENRLQAAELTEKQDVQRSSAETAMVVKPVSEQESSGGKSMLLYAAGPILGIIIAFAFSLVAETLDHSLRTPIEVEKHLGKPVLAVLPRMDPPRVARRQLPGTKDRSQATLPPG